MGHSTDAGALYQRYHAALHAFCVRNLDDKEEAADLVQDAFLNAWLALRTGFEPEAPYPWLLTIARNLCISRHRARSSRIQALHLDESLDLGATEERPTDDLIELTSLLRRLPERQRRALLLHEVKGLPYGEVAAELNISYAAVATLVFRTRRKLAQGLAHGNAAKQKPRRSFGLSWLAGILGPCSAPAKLGQRLNLVLGSGTPVKVAAALGVAPLVVLPSPVLGRGRDGGPVRTAASGHVSSSAALDRALRVSFRIADPNSSTHWSRVTVRAAAALTDPAPVNETTETAFPAGGEPAPVETSSGTPPTSDTGSPKPPESVAAVPPPPIRAEDATGASLPPVPSRQPAGTGDQNTSLAASPAGQEPEEEMNAPPADPGSQGEGPPADPGSPAQSDGPPADPGSQGNGSPPDPGSQAQSHGPPADPGSEGNGAAVEPSSQAESQGPPGDPGSQGNGSPPDPGSQAQSHGPPADPPSPGERPLTAHEVGDVGDQSSDVSRR